MIEEQGRVVATEPGAVWVETARRSTCSSCSVNAGCGQGLLQRLGVGEGRARVRALCDLSLRVGDGVILGIREDLLLRASILFYLFP
ncbi:transcriptional regulator, partial [Pseudomonas aeruginosa]|nr:transcriptional regulator [Pseudomonas aeruginosa]